MSERPVILGGEPLGRHLSWPDWPRFDEETEARLLDVLKSRRWTVSWASSGEPSIERRFAEAFAGYNGAPYGVSVDHGSSALVVALEALGIGPGDEVIAPAMTWVAPITAVLRVGALPVIVDVDSRSGCIAPDMFEAALTPQVKAVIVVHLACTVANITEIRAISSRHGVALIEDCAQAHGARIGDRNVGTFGSVGAFSFQAGKVLTGGEGGAVITADPDLYARLVELRADSRRYVRARAQVGEEELEVSGSIMGGNYCMSEWSAAVLLDRLKHLDEEHACREANATILEEGLAGIPGIRTLKKPDDLTKRSVYEFAIQIGEASPLGAVDAARVAEALSAELGFPCWQADVPLPRSPYFRPETKARFTWTNETDQRARGRAYPGAERYHRSTILWHHRALLGDSEHVAAIVAAIDKLHRHADELR